jgi:UDPglucose 6-dehydrogenase
MNITVVGTGYVGLVVGAGLADFGLQVTCIDSVREKIERLQRGEVPIYEPGLHELVQKNVKVGRLRFEHDLAAAVDRSLVLFIAVPTDPDSDGRPDLTALFSVGKQLAATMNEYRVIVIKSTVPVGTARKLADHIKARQANPILFDIISNPEFLREGSALENFLRPNRIILGHSSEQALAIVRDIYRPLYLIETPMVTTDNETAELVKYAANAFLATKISFINEVANLCDELGSDVHVVARAMGLDPRIGSKFLHPGPGFGGSCFPKDTVALVKMAADREVPMHIVQAATDVNTAQAGRIVEKVRKGLGSLQGQQIAVLGLAFKPNTDDVRQSPALRICELLLAEGAKIGAHDPVANENAAATLGRQDVAYHSTPYEAAEGAAALLVLTEWNEFRNLDLSRIRSLMEGDLLVDARNVYDPAQTSSLGFRYVGVGRRASRLADRDVRTAPNHVRSVEVDKGS